jgi:hypothetical protein
MTSTALDVHLGTSEAAGRAHATTSMRGAALVAARSGADEKRVLVLAILAAQAALLLAAVRLVGAHGWDDGAITLAYARTFAESGRIALTPASEHVEGFSSVAWFGLNALVALARPGFTSAILASQLLTLITLVASGSVLHRLGRAIGLRATTRFAVLATFACLGPLFSETVNGMEMGLLTLCGLVIVHRLYFERNRLVVWAALAMFVATRFESAFYIAFLLAPLLLEKRFCRWYSFDALLPNTIYAKMHEPYHLAGFAAVRSRLFASREIFVLFLPALLVLVVRALHLRAWSGILGVLRSNRALVAPVAGAVAFAMITGTNWGYLGRMQFFALPFMLLLVAQATDVFAASSPIRHYALVWSIAGLTVCSSMIGAPFEQLRASRTDAMSVTPAAFRETARAVEKVRTALGLPRIAFLTPDIGGVALCCPAIRVVDIALLTNRQLARDGYGVLGEVIDAERPEIIEAHGLWAKVSHLYELDAFGNGYQPTIIDHMRFYLRDDVADQLTARGNASTVSADRTDDHAATWTEHRYRAASNERDDGSFLSRGKVLLVR